MAIIKFSDWKRAVFRCGKEIKGLRGGVHRYAAQVSLQIDVATAEKSRLWTETNWQAALDGLSINGKQFEVSRFEEVVQKIGITFFIVRTAAA